MSKQSNTFESVAGCLFMSVAIVFLAWCAYKMADVVMLERKAEQQQIVNNRQYMKDQNCKVTGFYGKYGQYKVFTCDDGKVWREQDLL